MQRIEGMKSRGEGEEGRGECVDGALERAPRGIRRTVLKSREEGEEGRGQCVVTMQWATVE